MEDLDRGRPVTPTHHPTSGVRVRREEIQQIASLAFPSSDLLSIVQLPSGKSYNNRIYFLKLGGLKSGSGHPAAAQQEQQIVLKVNGRFFGANKIQNEVACLQLVQKYCPEVPAPHPLAWSEDGTIATFATPFETGPQPLDLPQGIGKLEHGGWILMSAVEGLPVPMSDLGAETLVDLGRQLGDIIASLRQNIPHQRHCGNVRLPPINLTRNPRPAFDDSRLLVRDILQDGIEVEEPITSINQYYQIILTDKVRELENSETYAPNRVLVNLLRTFIAETLPMLELNGDRGTASGEFVLTHYDLSPRNVLVSGSPPRITGLVDFEFAGFFPPFEEFLNDYISNADDWSRPLYDAYLARLEQLGEATPSEGFDANIWARNLTLRTLVVNIAPWDLPGGYNEEELRGRLKDARDKVLETIQNLAADEVRQ